MVIIIDKERYIFPSGAVRIYDIQHDLGILVLVIAFVCKCVRIVFAFSDAVTADAVFCLGIFRESDTYTYS